MLSRRFFLIGTAAAMAASRLAVLQSGEVVAVSEASPSKPFYRRRLINQLNITASYDSQTPARLWVARKLDGQPILDFSLKPGDAVRWHSNDPMNAIAQVPESAIIICVEGGAGLRLDAEMFYYEDGKGYVEQHFFPRSRRDMVRTPLEA